MFDTINTTVYTVSPKIFGGIIWGISLEPLPTIFTQYGPLKGGNSMGTTPDDGNGMGKLTSRCTDSSSLHVKIDIQVPKLNIVF